MTIDQAIVTYALWLAFLLAAYALLSRWLWSRYEKQHGKIRGE